MENKAILHDDSCEVSVLGTLISKVNAFNELRPYLDESCFYSTTNKTVFKAIKNVVERGESVTSISVLSELNKSDSNKIEPFDLIDMIEKSDSLSYIDFAKRLKELAIRRKYYQIGQTLITAGLTESKDIADVLAETKDSLNATLLETKDTVYSLDDSLGEWFEKIEESRKNKNTWGTPTGFYQIDEKGGLQGGDLIIVGGRTSNGKTSLAISFALSAINCGHGVAFYSLEMSRLQLTSRLIASVAGVTCDSLRPFNITDEVINRINENGTSLVGKPLYFDDKSTTNIDGIIASIYTMKIKYDIRGVIVDYLQIATMNTKTMNREQVTAEAARRLKNVGKELGIWIVALSQINRNQDDGEPTLSGLRDSGQIAEAADTVILIHRPSIYGKNYEGDFKMIEPRGTALLDVCKGRNIGTFKFIAGYDSERTRFFELTTPPLITEDRSTDF